MRSVMAAAMLLASPIYAQFAQAPLTFEVASIKPSAPGVVRSTLRIRVGGGDLRVEGATLKSLITMAYDVRDFQVSGGLGWINSDRFDVDARVERSSTENVPANPRKMTDEQLRTGAQQMHERLKALLAERCQLQVHRDTKEKTVYALVVGKGGLKLKETAGGTRPMMRMGRGQIIGQGIEIRMLAANLATQVGRPVIDQTGLEGWFDVKLEWTPDPGQSFGPIDAPPGVEPPPPPDPNGPSLFAALQEQLGLRL